MEVLLPLLKEEYAVEGIQFVEVIAVEALEVIVEVEEVIVEEVLIEEVIVEE